MQDPKETFNNIEQNTEMALLQSEKIAESVDNLEPIMEGILLKTDEMVQEMKKNNDKPINETRIIFEGVEMIKGIPGKTPQKGVDYFDGKDGKDGINGKDGKDGVDGRDGIDGVDGVDGKDGKDGVDGKDGKSGKDGKNGNDGSPDTPEQVKEKLLKVGLDYNELDNTPDINQVINIAVASVKQSSKTYSIPEMDDVKLTNLTNADTLKWNSTTKKWENGAVASSTTWSSITGTQSDVNVGGFTNDVGYLTSTDLTGYVPTTRTLTINGTTYDLTADRTWSVGTVTSVAALTLGTTGTDLSSTVANSTTTPVITLNVPTASALNRGALSSTDWSTFNSKESALTFSTGLTRSINTITNNLSTGISGGQSVIGGTASGNNLTLSSTSNATKGKILFGDSAYDEVNNRLGIGISSPVVKLHVLTGTYIAPVSDTNYVVQNSGQYVAEYIGTDGAYAGFQVRGTGAATQPFVQYYNSSTGKAWTQMMTTAGDLNILKGNALGTTLLTLGNNLNVGIAKATPTARLHLPAGTATANTAPIKLTSGTNLTTPENGALEYDGTSLFFTPASTRYNVLMNGLGLAGGQTVVGGTASGNNLTLSSTSNATKGKILFGNSAYDEVNNRLGVGTTTPTAKLDVRGSYDFWGIQVGNGTVGTLFQVYGGNAGFVGFNGSAYNSLDIRSGINSQLFIATNGGVGIGGQTAPTAKLHLSAGTATAGTAPLKFTTGTNLTTAEVGAIEYNNTFHVTNSDATRRHVATAPNTTKVTTAAPYTNDGYITINIGGTDFKVMTTA